MRAAGIVLGVGIGGFIDGIFLHQIFQVHAMLSAKVPLDSMANMQTNMTADGVFHAAMLVAVILGIVLLFKASRREDVLWSGSALTGSMLMGWGLFNVVEGIIDHHVLQLHHVVERLGLSKWDWAFLAGSLGLIVLGVLIARQHPHQSQ
ncbi:DUF2243 domain-containing protein [Novosphingobium sp. 9U]|uniref:DUF2243 domain-containing protein n=1 Tax=Novosphingobium sp. 9U TaxID=2653158 RepID=UPI00135796DA|nr:DUF2243 domain-containing protein [Novosphingobium sp. 9U]